MAKTTARPSHRSTTDPWQRVTNLWYVLLFIGLGVAGFFLWPYLRFGITGFGVGVLVVLGLALKKPDLLVRFANLAAAYFLAAWAADVALSVYQDGWGGRLGDTFGAWHPALSVAFVTFITLTAIAIGWPKHAWKGSKAAAANSVWAARVLYTGTRAGAQATAQVSATAAEATLEHLAEPAARAASPVLKRLTRRFQKPALPMLEPPPAAVVGQQPAQNAIVVEPTEKSQGSRQATPQAETKKKQAPQPAQPEQSALVADDASAPKPEPKHHTRNGGGGWKLPALLTLQEEPKAESFEEENKEKAKLIEQTLSDYGIEVEVTTIRPGPVVTQFGLVPGWVRKVREMKEREKDGRPKLDRNGRPLVTQVEEKTRVRVDTILSREKDLAMALAAKSLRFEAPVPGEQFMGLEVPNLHPAMVTMRGVMDTPGFKALLKKGNLPITLGKGSGGEPVVADLTEMPHLLIAGATGSGKSVCMNTIVGSLLMYQTPYHVRVVMTDPKRVELTPYNGIPHLALPVVVEPDEAVPMLRGVIREMQDRFKRLEAAGVRNIQAFNSKAETLEARMPFLVVIIDELADLMMSAPVDVEQSLCRLAQLGRAVGIHLVVATQRPSVDVITGLIKANFPSRISFAVTSQVDSRTILDSAGAEKLLGKGDMLFAPIGSTKPKRVQGAYVSDKEIAQVVQVWKEQQGTAVPPLALITEKEAPAQDELLNRAKDLAEEHRTLSASLLQRKLGIGYPRASRLLDQLEEQGIVVPGEQGKSRQVVGREADDMALGG